MDKFYYTLKCPRSWANEPKKVQKLIDKWKKCRTCRVKKEKEWKGTKYYFIVLSVRETDSHYWSGCDKRERVVEACDKWGVLYDLHYNKPRSIWTKKEIERHAKKRVAKLAKKEAAKNFPVIGRLFTADNKHKYNPYYNNIEVYIFTSERGKRCNGVRYRKIKDTGEVSTIPVQMWKTEIYNHIQNDTWRENDLNFLIKYGAPGDLIAQSAEPWLEALRILGRLKE